MCNRVKYEIDGKLKDVLNCHCSKLHGAAFRTRAQINTADWRTIQGQQFIKFYESSPGEHKGFCSECGSSLYTKFDAKPEVLGFPLGTLDTDPKVTPSRHIFVGSKAPWHEIADNIPQQQEYE